MVEVAQDDVLASIHQSIGVMVLNLLNGSARPSRQHKVLSSYIILLLFVNLVAAIVNFISSQFCFILAIHPMQDRAMQTILGYFKHSMPLTLATVTDALLSSEWPGASPGLKIKCLWAHSPVLLDHHACALSSGSRSLMTILACTSLGMNVLLNLYTAIFITYRLLRHRNATISSLGDRARTGRHLHMIGIVLQSAALNVPVTIAALGGMVSGNSSSSILSPIAVTCQSLSAVLIIHQVVSKKAIDVQNEQRIERRHSSSEGGKLTTFSVVFTDSPGESHIT
ncbi:hypothetical protein D9756_002547 [Leucocoprinus leucothites]|uniref:Uncharacterized protein n=1 Tax=Leucocoprinus leucothites TaxID=201217 RepID=A0A8H5GBZ7_9AGAR|nr:hypothetical protein D9756_002547 [Leucoagaricus leucothites]